MAVLFRPSLFLSVIFLMFQYHGVNSQIKALPLPDVLAEVKSIQEGNIPSQIEDVSTNEDIMRRIQTFMMNAQADQHNVSSQCWNDTNVFRSDWPDKNYARQMFVSFGDLPEILRQIEFTWCPQSLGGFDICRAVEPEPGIHSFGAQYCTARPFGLLWGVCFPDSCSDDDVTYILSQGAGLPVESTGCYVDQPYRTGDYICIVVFSILALLMIIGTGYDLVWQRNMKKQLKESMWIKQDQTIKQQLIDTKSTVEDIKKKKPGYLGRILISFSVITNAPKLLSTEQRGSRTLSCLNGIRVISLFWVMLGHSISFPLGSYSNNRYLFEDVILRFSFLAVFGGVYAVDTFFLLSGCLVAYLTLKELYKSNGKLNWLLFYFHRYWRLTPAFALAILLNATLVIHMGDGPYHNISWIGAQEVCQEYWWVALLYFNNLYPWPGNLGEMCFGHGWYLQVDMQLYIISPIFLILLYKSFAAGTSLLAVATVLSVGVTAGLSAYFGFPIGGNDSTYYNDNLAEAGDDWTYAKPYSRLQVYMVGLFLGYVLCRLNDKRIKLNKFVNLVCWILAAGVALTVVYGIYPTNEGKHPDQWIAVLYLATGRFAFVVAVAWVIFACATGNGGPVNTFLSWSGWMPLSRLNYCAYLLHVPIMYLYITNLKQLITYSDITGTYLFIANVVLSYLCAFIFSLAIESPMIGLEKILLRR